MTRLSTLVLLPLLILLLAMPDSSVAGAEDSSVAGAEDSSVAGAEDSSVAGAEDSSAEDSWPSFRGAHGDGQAAEGLPPGDGPLRLERRWVRPLGSGYAGIAVGGGLVVTAFADGERDIVAAFDPVSGDERWRYDLSPTYNGHDGSHDGPIATPALGGGRVFALGAWGHLAALDLNSGKELWTTHLTDDLGSKKPMFGFSSSPVVVGDVVVLQIGGDDGSLAAFEVATGEVKWRSVEDRVFTQSPIVAEIGGRLQVLVMGMRKVAGVDPTDGTVLWEHEHHGGFSVMGDATSSPMPLDGDRIFLKHGEDSTLTLGITAEESGFAATVLSESRGLSKSYSPAAAANDEVYGFTSRFLSAVDPTTGELLWKSRQPGDGFLVSVGGQLAVLTKEGTLHLGAASPDGWTETDHLDLFSDLAWTAPSVVGGSLYLRSLGELARVDILRGTTTAEAAPDKTKSDEALPAALRCPGDGGRRRGRQARRGAGPFPSPTRTCRSSTAKTSLSCGAATPTTSLSRAK